MSASHGTHHYAARKKGISLLYAFAAFINGTRKQAPISVPDEQRIFCDEIPENRAFLCSFTFSRAATLVDRWCFISVLLVGSHRKPESGAPCPRRITVNASVSHAGPLQDPVYGGEVCNGRNRFLRLRTLRTTILEWICSLRHTRGTPILDEYLRHFVLKEEFRKEKKKKQIRFPIGWFDSFCEGRWHQLKSCRTTQLEIKFVYGRCFPREKRRHSSLKYYPLDRVFTAAYGVYDVTSATSSTKKYALTRHEVRWEDTRPSTTTPVDQLRRNCNLL